MNSDEKIDMLKKRFGIKKDDEFGHTIGVSQATISAWRNRPTGISKEGIEKIITKYNKVNIEWLMGKSDVMMKDEPQSLANLPISLPATIATDEASASGFYYPNVDASAGLDVLYMDNTEAHRVPVHVPLMGRDLHFINVFGESMHPKYKNGDIIGIKETTFDFIHYGYDYVVLLSNGDVLLKTITKGSNDNQLNLNSVNPAFESKEYKREQFTKFFIVKGVISQIMM